MPELTTLSSTSFSSNSSRLIAVLRPVLCAMSCCGRSAVMLREGRLPGRSFQRLLSGEQEQLAGFVMGELLPGACCV